MCGSLTFGQVSRLGLSTTRWILIRGNEYIKEKSLFFSSYPSRRHTAFFCSCCRCPFSLCTHALISANGTVPRRGTTDFLDLLEPPQQGCVEPPFKREDAKKKIRDGTKRKRNITKQSRGWRGTGRGAAGSPGSPQSLQGIEQPDAAAASTWPDGPGQAHHLCSLPARPRTRCRSPVGAEQAVLCSAQLWGTQHCKPGNHGGRCSRFSEDIVQEDRFPFTLQVTKANIHHQP